MAGITISDRRRFTIELEFVQSLANPYYLQHLAQNGYFDDAEFLNYLRYLQYWCQPQYARYITYPYCLEVLDLLQQASFRQSLLATDFALFLHRKEYNHWRWWQKNQEPAEKTALDRLVDEVLSNKQQEGPPAAPEGAPVPSPSNPAAPAVVGADSAPSSPQRAALASTQPSGS